MQPKLHNVKGIITTHDWEVVNSDQYGSTVLPTRCNMTMDQGYCAPACVALLTNTHIDTVARHMREYDKYTCTRIRPGIALSTMQQYMHDLCGVEYYEYTHKQGFNELQDECTQGTYIVHTRENNTGMAHYTILQDGMEYGSGTSMNHMVMGYWRLD